MNIEDKIEPNLQLSTWVNSYINVLLKTIIEEENKDGEFTIKLENKNHSKFKQATHDANPNEPIYFYMETDSPSTHFIDKDKEESLESFVTVFIRDTILKNSVQQLLDEESALKSANNSKEVLEGLVCSENPMEDYIRYRLKSIYGDAVIDSALHSVVEKVPQNAQWSETFNAIDSLLLCMENNHKLEKSTPHGQSGRVACTIVGKIKVHAVGGVRNKEDSCVDQATLKDLSVQGDAQAAVSKGVPSSSAVDGELNAAATDLKGTATEHVPNDVQGASGTSEKTEQRKTLSRQRQLLSKAKSSFARFLDMFE